MPPRNLASFAFLFVAAAILCALPVSAHELWIETNAQGRIGQAQQIQVCWGHSGAKESGQMLAQQRSKLSGAVVPSDGRAQAIPLALGSDSYTADFTPRAPGYQMIGAELQVGIIDREFHGIPAHTRIVMYGKSFTLVPGSDKGLDNALGFDLEIVPAGDPSNLHPGDVVQVKVLLHGKPIGGRDVVVSLGTTGPQDLPQHPDVSSRQWSIEANAERSTGQVSFPLIAAGQHLFSIRYFDETPGTYQGELDEASEFSHLRKGDAFERTMYVSTFAFEVNAQ